MARITALSATISKARASSGTVNVAPSNTQKPPRGGAFTAIPDPEGLLDEFRRAKCELGKAVDEKRMMGTRVRSVEEENRKLKKQLEAVKVSQISMSEDENKAIAGLKTIILDKDQKIDRLQSELYAIKQSVAVAKIHEFEIELDTYFQEIVRLRRQIEHDKVGSNLVDKCGLTEKLADFDELVESYREKLTALEREHRSSLDTIAALEDELRETEEQRTELETHLESVRGTLTSVCEDLEGSKGREAVANESLSSATSEISYLRSVISEKDSTIAEVRKEAGELSDSLTRANEREEALSARISELESQCDSSRDNVGRLQVELASALAVMAHRKQREATLVGTLSSSRSLSSTGTRSDMDDEELEEDICDCFTPAYSEGTMSD
ncbi:hypothetical protein BJ742DRAFT_835071 [Cladochytrium replicatum]|nr:hypothetical protein BJ742DRAFT_835071 [Cladochytrium replicatum]